MEIVRSHRQVAAAAAAGPDGPTAASASATRPVTAASAPAGRAVQEVHRALLGVQLHPGRQAPLTALLEYSGILCPDPGGGIQQTGTGAGPGEVWIRIVAPGEAGTSSERAEEAIVEEEEEDGHATRTRPEEPSPTAGGVEAGMEFSSSYQRYDIQQVARWVEQILPF